MNKQILVGSLELISIGIYNYDFNISAQTKKYAPIGTITLNSPVIKNNIKNYISTRYGNNCTNGCIIPINFTSGTNQKISVTQPSLSYVTGYFPFSRNNLI